MTDNIISHAWNYPLPYLTISYATGQWYLTKVWEEYHQRLPPNAAVLTRVLMDGRPGAPPWKFFTHSGGGTWNNWDNYMFGWIGDHLGLIGLVVVAVVGLVVSAARKLSLLPLASGSAYRITFFAHQDTVLPPE